MPELKPVVTALPKIPLGVSDWNKLADKHKNYWEIRAAILAKRPLSLVVKGLVSGVLLTPVN